MMYKKTLTILFLVFSFVLKAQTDFSNDWEDFYSYNDVKDIFNTDNKIIALTDNAIFIYDKQTKTSEKISSINGLSGATTSAFYYDEIQEIIVVGYENGLVEIINSEKKIITKLDILNFAIAGSKRINEIAANGMDLYFATPFGIVNFDLETKTFKDTYFIGFASSEVVVNDIEIFNNKIYAATEIGIYSASIDNEFLIDYENWNYFSSANISNIESFNNQIYVSSDINLFRFDNNNTLSSINVQDSFIKDLTSNTEFLTLTTENEITIFDSALQDLFFTNNISSNFPYNANSASTYNNELFICTEQFGVLKSDFSSNINNFEEIHPDGPISNKVFSITVNKGHLWVVYGGYNQSYSPYFTRKGVSHFNGNSWHTIPYGSNSITYKNLVQVSVDPSNENKAYISSWGDGMVIIENDVVISQWNQTNSGLEILAPNTYNGVRIGGSVFDDEGNLWVANAWVANKLKKYNPTTDTWTSFNLSSLESTNTKGINHIVIDKTGNKWIGTRDNGTFVVNKDGSKKKAFNTNPSTGNLPSNTVAAIAVDSDNAVWIGTRHGLRKFNSNASFFDQASFEARPIVLEHGEDDGFGEALLGEQTINSICVDGANNKWYGTASAGVLQTNPSGDITYLHFDKGNSPLAANNILTIQFDEITGKIFFATNKGIVAYKSGISPYGEHLEEVYAYPNPATKNNDFVTIDGRFGTHIPNGTNVKILDTAGKLVFETNVTENQEQYGGKVVWDKRNLAGRKVASGIYIVLLVTKDISEKTMTKIAIIN